MASFTSEEAKREVFDVVNSFVQSIVSEPPLTKARGILLDSGFRFFSLLGGHTMCDTLGKAMSDIEQFNREDGAKPLTLDVDVSRDVWVYLSTAAVWGIARQIDNDGTETYRFVMAFSLSKVDEIWKISAYSQSQLPLDQPVPPITTEFLPGIQKTIDISMDMEEVRKGNPIDSWAFPGVGGIHHMLPNKPEARLVSDHTKGLDAWINSMPLDTKFEMIVKDTAVRVCGEFAFAWDHFAFTIDGNVHTKGIHHWVMIERNGKWLVCNCLAMGEAKE